MYGGIDDTSLLGEQNTEIDLRGTIRKASEDFFIRGKNKGYSCYHYGAKGEICKRVTFEIETNIIMLRTKK